jgi:hypothetical protein
MMEKFIAAGLSSKIYFGNTTLLKRKDDITLRKYVCAQRRSQRPVKPGFSPA